MEKELECGSPSALPSRAPSAVGKGWPPLSLSRTWPPSEEIPSFWTANPGQHSDTVLRILFLWQPSIQDFASSYQTLEQPRTLASLPFLWKGIKPFFYGRQVYGSQKEIHQLISQRFLYYRTYLIYPYWTAEQHVGRKRSWDHLAHNCFIP